MVNKRVLFIVMGSVLSFSTAGAERVGARFVPQNSISAQEVYRFYQSLDGRLVSVSLSEVITSAAKEVPSCDQLADIDSMLRVQWVAKDESLIMGVSGFPYSDQIRLKNRIQRGIDGGLAGVAIYSQRPEVTWDDRQIHLSSH